MGKTIVIYIKFIRDVACRKLLKSANRVIQKITLAPFIETRYIYIYIYIYIYVYVYALKLWEERLTQAGQRWHGDDDEFLKRSLLLCYWRFLRTEEMKVRCDYSPNGTESEEYYWNGTDAAPSRAMAL